MINYILILYNTGNDFVIQNFFRAIIKTCFTIIIIVTVIITYVVFRTSAEG